MVVNAQAAPPRELEGLWTRLDRAIYRAESLAVIAATTSMTVLVFLAVVWRIMAAPTGKMAEFLAAVSGADVAAVQPAGDALAFLLWLLLCGFGVRTARPQWALPRTLGTAVAIASGSAAGAWGLVVLLPEGLVFAQKTALAMFMWVVLLGSSMAAHTRRHIFLQAAQKLVPASLSRLHASLGLFGAALFTVFLATVGMRYALANFENWLETNMNAGTFESVPIPYWAVTIAIPLGFGLTAARFVGQGIGILRGLLEPVPPSEEVEAARAQSHSLDEGA